MSSNTITLAEESVSDIVIESDRQMSSEPVRPTWLQQAARRRLLNWLDTLKGGTVCFTDPYGSFCLGRPAVDGQQAQWQVTDPSFYSLLASGGSLGMAESFLRGQWQTDDLTSLLTILCRNLTSIPAGNAASLGNFVSRIAKLFQHNTRQTSKRHIAAHYDLSNEFFELFLDPTMMYSSGYFEHEDSTLLEASVAKLDQICGKLDLQKNDRVLEIGTGWGGFAMHAASRHEIDLTTTTISDAQYQKAAERLQHAELAGRVKLLNVDYRDLTGTFDKIVSIEMVEAVGDRFMDTYFRRCSQLLKPGGRFVLQAIVMPEQRYQSYRRSADFIQKYIFPGGFMPSVAAMQESVGRTSNLRLQHIEDLSSHYGRTLSEWRNRFFERLDDVRRLGFDDRFIRMWEYYLCYCEAAFQEQAVGVVQIVWDKPTH